MNNKKTIFIVILTVIILGVALYVYRFRSYKTENQTTATTSDTTQKENDSTSNADTKSTEGQSQQLASTFDGSGNGFRSPTADKPPYIVGAQIETIKIPDCDICSVDIVKSIPGVSDKRIIEINNRIAGDIFGNKDIRKVENRIVLKEVGIDSFNSSIIYVDKGLMQIYSREEIYYTGATKPSRDTGSYSLLSIDPSISTFLFDKDYPYTNKEKILPHFYPKGDEFFEKYVGSEENELSENSVCLDGNEYPDDFYPTLRAGTQEVVFSYEFPYASTGPCSPGLEIAIPIADILKEVPELVPKDSVLWKFK